MENTLFDWLLNLISEFAKFGTWLTTPLSAYDLGVLDVITKGSLGGATPLSLFGFAGLTALVAILVAHLFTGWV